MNRKDFLLQSGMSLVAFTLPFRNNYAFARTAESAAACIPTTADILGPYYRANAPLRSDLTVSGNPTSHMFIKGIVSDHNCNPIPNATVDIWQADQNGAYDNNTPAYDYRGKFVTSADGAYEFKSIKPGYYLNGPQYRPAHIHFRVTAGGHTELITQLYFQGDPYIAADPWASDSKASQRIVPINTTAGVTTAEFNISLQGNTSGMNEIQNQSPLKLNNPVVTDLLINAGNDKILNIEIFDSKGQLILCQYDLNSKEFQLPMHYIASGIYYARIECSNGIFVHKIQKQENTIYGY